MGHWPLTMHLVWVKIWTLRCSCSKHGSPPLKDRPLIILLLLLHPFNGLFSRTTCVSQHQKGKEFWILLEQEMIGWQWHQLDHMQIICTSLQTDNHASSSLSFYRPDALPAAQPTASKHWRHKALKAVLW